MISTKELDPNLLEAEFYDKPFNFSYSSLNKLITSPGIFYTEYILKKREVQYGKHLLEGTIIHYLVLENQGFDEKFIVSSETLPGETNMIVANYCFDAYAAMKDPDETLELCDFEPQILECLKNIDKHQSLKDTKDGLGDDKRVNKIVEPKTEEYFKFLKNKEGRTIIDSAMLDKCTRRGQVVTENVKMRELLGLDLISDGIKYGVYNELYVEVPAKEGSLFGFKGFIDNLVVDVAKKAVYINDFKTTGKTLTKFDESVDFWNYWMQAAVYKQLVKDYLKAVLTDEWTIEFRFIVFDKYDQLYAFEVTNETMDKWETRLQVAIKEASYHYESRDFTLPYDFAKGNVKL